MNSRSQLDFRFGGALLFILLIFSGSRSDQQTTPAQPLPLVLSASVPFYPAVPRKAGIEGEVRVSVTTDGKKASAFHVLSGHNMLVSATIDVIKSWQFQQHDPTTFETVFRYKLLQEAECYFDAPTVRLHLPDTVEVTAKRIWTCDPLSDTSGKGAPATPK
jgi:hypothetical protein